MAHLLIAVATSEYPNMPPSAARPTLASTTKDVVNLFTATMGGYQRELLNIADNPTSTLLRRELDAWFASPARQADDWVVLYYTGHADLVNDSLYLLTTDFVPPLYFGTAVELSHLAHVVQGLQAPGRHRQIRNLLVIVDTCFAGRGITGLATRLGNALRLTSGSSFYMLGAALPRQEAKAGALAKALIQAVEELSARHVAQEYLFFEQLVPAINRKLKVHKAILVVVDSADESPRFFPNRNFVDTDGNPVSARDARRAIDDQEFRQHWGPRARGVELDAQPGDYFTGRTAALDMLWSYLRAPGGCGMHVVTGRPGVGKSAILAQIVSRAMNQHAASDAPRLDVAVHAKAKTLHDVVTRVAAILGSTATVEDVVSAIGTRQGPVRLVVDALDEATEPIAIASHLLTRLAAIPSAKLIVGTRPEYVRLFHAAEVIDLDRDEYSNIDDLTAYVRNRLLRSHEEPPAPTPYAGQLELAQIVAREVAVRASPNFLVARLIVEDLLSRPHAVDPTDVDVLAFPTKVADAFDNYLARFGVEERRVREILLPLAYAEGQGLPWDNLWAPVAGALARRTYDDGDVRWVLEHAGAFVLESTDLGRSVYRLYHQALSETLRKGKRGDIAHRKITAALVASAPARLDTSSADWLLASRYVRTHLSTHSGYAHGLEPFLSDPLYLIAADPTRLLHAIARDPALPRPLIAAYRGCVHHIRAEAPASAAAYLELVARQQGLSDVANGAATLPLSHPWHARWARWSPRAPSQRLASGQSEIMTLSAVETRDFGVVVLVGRWDGTVEAWNVATGLPLARWRPDNVQAVWQVGFAETPDGPVLVAAWYGGEIGTYELQTHRQVVLADDTGGRHAATALCIATNGDQMVCVTAHQDRRVVVRSIPALKIVLARPSLTKTKIYGLTHRLVDGLTILVSAGDSLIADEDGTDSSKLRLWSLEDLRLLWEDDRRSAGAAHDIEETQLDGRSVAVVSQNSLGPAQIWDLATRELLFESSHSSRRAWVYSFRNESLFLELRFGALQVSRLVKSVVSTRYFAEPIGRGLWLSGDRFSELATLQGRTTLFSAVGGHVRVWDVEDLLAMALDEPVPISGTDTLEDVSSVVIHPQHTDCLFVGTRAGLAAVSLTTGAILWSTGRVGRDGRHEAIEAIAAIPGTNSLAVAGAGGLLLHFDLQTQGFHDETALGHEIERLRVTSWRGHTLAFATVERSGDWGVLVHDLETNTEIETSSMYQLSLGEQDKRMAGLTLTAIGEDVRLAFASSYGKVMVATFANSTDVASRYRAFEEWRIPDSSEYVSALASANMSGELRLAAATRDGQLAVWDFTTGVLQSSKPGAHLGPIPALEFGFLGDRLVLVSGGADGHLQVWTPDLVLLKTIEIGEPISTIALIDNQRVAVGGPRGLLLVAWTVTPPLSDTRPGPSS